MIGIPATTLGRRRQSGRLTPMESDHVVRVARLVAMARTLMADDTEAARRWLTTPHRLLGDETTARSARGTPQRRLAVRPRWSSTGCRPW